MPTCVLGTFYIRHTETEEAVAGVCLRAYLVHSTHVFFVTRATKDGKIVNSAVGTYHRPGFKRQLMFQDVTAKYCIYDKVPSLPMSFFVRIKGCVNFCTTTSVYKNAY